MTAASQDPWHGILARNEEILWQGQPAPKLRLRAGNIKETMGYVFFILISVFWMFTASRSGGLFWTFGLIFFGIGLWKVLGEHIWQAHRRKSTYYTLTDRRAIIAVDAGGQRSLQSYPITADTPIQMIDGELSDIYFAEQTKRGLNRQMVTIPIGFELIHDGRSVMALMRQMQERAA